MGVPSKSSKIFLWNKPKGTCLGVNPWGYSYATPPALVQPSVLENRLPSSWISSSFPLGSFPKLVLIPLLLF